MKRFLIALAVSGLAGGAASAQVSPEAGKQMFDKVDTNHDGVLTLDEWKAAGRRERGFEFIDANHDGKITPEELRAAAAKFNR